MSQSDKSRDAGTCTEVTANAAAPSTVNRNVMLARGRPRFKRVGSLASISIVRERLAATTAFRVMPEDGPLNGEGGL